MLKHSKYAKLNVCIISRHERLGRYLFKLLECMDLYHLLCFFLTTISKASCSSLILLGC